MAYFEAPSFSLGLDLGFDSEPQFPLPDPDPPAPKPASPIPKLNCVTEIGNANDPPSFSLGLDLGIDSEPQIPHPVQASLISKQDCVAEIGNGNDRPRKLKRLKRGPFEAGDSSMPKQKEPPSPFPLIDDDIEEFSSQEDFGRDSHPSHFQSVCSSSKVPLHGILTAPTSSQLKARGKKQVLDAPPSFNLEKQNKSLFPNLTISPLRKFQLLESDSDDPTKCDNQSIKRHKTFSSINKQKTISDYSATISEEKKRLSASITQKEDLWKDFCQTKSKHLQTPAFDEVCEEYFQSRKEDKAGTKLGSNSHTSCENRANNSGCLNELRDKLNCPAHYYFLHDDPRIEKLVRDRLPNFFPLGVNGSTTSVIDYMRQFSNGEASTRQAPLQISKEKSSKSLTDVLNRTKNGASKLVSPLSSKKAPKRAATRKNKIDKSSRNVKNKAEGFNSEELGSWIDPKSSSSFPRDAGKRRVHASGQSAGHWYTSPEGKKVYVSKSGEELTGRTAYRSYKKDNGSFRKSKKKGGSKKRKE